MTKNIFSYLPLMVSRQEIVLVLSGQGFVISASNMTGVNGILIRPRVYSYAIGSVRLYFGTAVL